MARDLVRRQRPGLAFEFPVLDFPMFCGHVNLALIVALENCDGHEIQFGKDTASL
jgi:hypothetical protein